MPLSVVDLYRDVLPKTNCKECGHSTCLAFASMVVSEGKPISGCPHLNEETITFCEKELKQQYDDGKWVKRDLAKDALEWAKSRAASMDISDLPQRIGGEIIKNGSEIPKLKLPYFTGSIHITPDTITHENGKELSRWEQVFLFNHVAQGGSIAPTGVWKGFVEFPNTVSKVISMKSHVEKPLVDHFTGNTDSLLKAALSIGGIDKKSEKDSADVCVYLSPLPKVPVMLLFWDEVKSDGFEAEAKLLFDETITEHLDIESIVFLSERIVQLLCSEN